MKKCVETGRNGEFIDLIQLRRNITLAVKGDFGHFFYCEGKPVAPLEETQQIFTILLYKMISKKRKKKETQNALLHLV